MSHGSTRQYADVVGADGAIFGVGEGAAPYGVASRLVSDGAILVPGSSSAPYEFCSRTKKDGSPCGARPANGTDACAGHLRSEGAL